MKPKLWRTSECLTLRTLSKRFGITEGYISRVERGKQNASGRIITAYHKFSKGRVSPADFKRKTDRKVP